MQDLVHWEHLDHAIVPTKGSVDNDGCFSGCAAVDVDGVPCLLYTGVSLARRQASESGKCPGTESSNGGGLCP